MKRIKTKNASRAAAALIAGSCSVLMLGLGRLSGRNVPARHMMDFAVGAQEISAHTSPRPSLAAGGSAFGIKLVTDGVMIIDMKELSGKCPAKKAGLRIGDVIETVNGNAVYTNARISELIAGSMGEPCEITYRREDKTLSCDLTPVLYEGTYRAGMWVRDSSAGIGTMTFIDPETGIFAGLGHSVCDADTHEPLPLSHGTISNVRINGLKKGIKGEPGQLMGEFSGTDCGELLLNCEGGVYGSLDIIPRDREIYPMAYSNEVHKGAARILTQTDSGEPKSYDITIEEVSPGSEHELVISTNDPTLKESAGGIVQGMSGSPIIQDGKLAGAVTHVFIDDPTGGYGILAEQMYGYAQQAEELITEKSTEKAG